MTIEELIAVHGIGFTCRLVHKPPDQPATTGQYYFRCRLTCGGRGMTIHHFHDSQLAGRPEPTAVDVLTRLMPIAKVIWKTKTPRFTRPRGASGDINSFLNWCVYLNLDPSTSVQETQTKYITLRREVSQLRYVIGRKAFEKLLAI